jgi:hypothetical protein
MCGLYTCTQGSLKKTIQYVRTIIIEAGLGIISKETFPDDMSKIKLEK